MTALSSLLFSCFQAFLSVPSRPVPLLRPSFVTNLLRQPVSDLFQFYAAFPLPSRLISFSVTFSLSSRLISFSVTFSLPSRLIPFFAAFSPLSRLILDFFLLLSVHLSFFQCIFSCAIILSVSLTYIKSIYFIIKCFFECRFGQAKGTGSPLTENQCPALFHLAVGEPAIDHLFFQKYIIQGIASAGVKG